jgi:hypothetical protein
MNNKVTTSKEIKDIKSKIKQLKIKLQKKTQKLIKLYNKHGKLQ